MSTLLRPRARSAVTLADLGFSTETPGGGAELITGIGLDSRTIESGWLYVALPGARSHGASFADQARQRGAVAVLTDDQGGAVMAAQGIALPTLVVANPRAEMARVAARLFDQPASKLSLFGITGTNGKTTTAFLIDAALTACGMSVGTIGTMGYLLGGRQLESSRTTVTTPESVDLQALLAVFVEREAQAAVMEVSSHALALNRADAIEFEVVGFTHLGRDHLDFHHTIEDYFEAKASLFQPGRSRHAVVMDDGDAGRELIRRIRAAGTPELTTVSGHQSGEGAQPEADVWIVSNSKRPDGGSVIEVDLRGTRVILEIDLPGEHNVRNAVLALAMVTAAGMPADTAAAGLRHAQVPGRMQRVAVPDGPTVIVDFAHTPQAISEAVTLAGSFPRTAVVLGAGGDRDVAKRSPMGQAAAVADLVVVTDDNPRTEDPATIRAAVVAGARAGRAEVREIGDRREAIRAALSWAHPDDLVLVLGKGHEQGQQINDQVIPFDDVVVIGELWQEVRHATS